MFNYTSNGLFQAKQVYDRENGDFITHHIKEAFPWAGKNVKGELYGYIMNEWYGVSYIKLMIYQGRHCIRQQGRQTFSWQTLN